MDGRNGLNKDSYHDINCLQMKDLRVASCMNIVLDSCCNGGQELSITPECK